MTYQSTLTSIRTDCDQKVMEAWRLYGLGRISKPQFAQLAAAIIAQSSSKAAAVADISLSVELVKMTANIHAPLGVLPRGYDQQLFEKGMVTLLADADAGEDITARLSRFALNAPLDAATTAYSDGIKASKSVEGWVRQMDADPCQLCRWWWREGRVWPADHSMPHHKGCECTQRIVTVEKAAPVQR